MIKYQLPGFQPSEFTNLGDCFLVTESLVFAFSVSIVSALLLGPSSVSCLIWSKTEIQACDEGSLEFILHAGTAPADEDGRSLEPKLKIIHTPDHVSLQIPFRETPFVKSSRLAVSTHSEDYQHVKVKSSRYIFFDSEL